MLRRLRTILPLSVVASLALALAAPVVAHAQLMVCSMLTIRVPSVDGGPIDVKMAGTLCRPEFQPMPHTVQLLVHGATYTRAAFNWPQNPATYSYAQDAIDAGYATFAVDRLGHGESDHPAANNLTIQAGTTALHGVVQALRSGALGGTPFTKVIFVGTSLGAVHGYDYGGRYSDIDGYAFFGSVHFIKQSWFNLFQANIQPWPADPNSGYLTSAPGSRGALFYNTATADPAVINQDEALKDTITGAEINTALPFVQVSAASSPTQSINKPVLIHMGQFDNLACGGPDGIASCTVASIQSLEQPYFTHATSFTVQITANSGHQLSEHPTAPTTHTNVINWIKGFALP
jgi:pimeloyl-ACP methyl ester carboxylesterase